MTKKSFLVLISFVPFVLMAQTATDSFIRGVDISFTPQIEDLGGKYFDNGVQKDALDIFKENGVNYVRLRIWHTPSDGYCGLEKTLAYAARIKAKGFKFLLDFHYSDWWADPGKQNKPAAWTNLSFSVLKDSVYGYTKNVVEALKNQNVLPDMIQIGNEITAGMLWPDGRVPTSNPTLAWQQFGELVKEGILGARDAAQDTTMKIMIHIDRGGDNSGARWFFDNLIAQSVQFDVIGLSYYPWWHGTLTQLTNNLNDLAVRYHKEIIVAETAYPWTLQSDDNVGNVLGSSTGLLSGYPASVKGQKDFLFALIKIIKGTSNKKGIGFFYWEPSYISVPPIGSTWENLTTFDFSGNAMNSLTAFWNLDTLKTINVTLRVNTSTLGDTLTPAGTVQIRGEVQGISSSILPSGDAITWDGTTQFVMKNEGGDYWDYQLKMYPSDQLQFKIWTGFNANAATYRNLGWEGPVTPPGPSNVYRVLIAGSQDTVLPIQYYNPSGAAVDQYWTPISPRTDSVAVLFRVNTAKLTSQGVFNPATEGPIVVRGDSVASGGVLSWTTTKVVLHRETPSVADSSFWSGVAYFPKSSISAGSLITYKFFVENSLFGGKESNISDRSFNFPTTDTTLAWRFFNDRIVPTGISENENSLPTTAKLFANFPNPFNPETNIRFSIPRRTHILVDIYNTLGQRVRTLVDETRNSGTFSVRWDGTDGTGAHLASGIYLLRMSTGNEVLVQKMLLLK
jgi:arabinogalactan endo-1,4-beta-galactosidase